MAQDPGKLYSELADLHEECRQPDWDGYGAYPVSGNTRDHAARFIAALPGECPEPSLGAEPDGHVTLEWHCERSWTLTVSITPQGELHYAALLGDDRVCGSIPSFDQVPTLLLELICRVFAA